MQDDDWFSLAELTQRLGALVWVEGQVAELLVGWSRIEAAGSVALAFRATGGHHQWHAEILTDCLPTSPLLEPKDAVRPPTTGWQKAVETLSSLTDPEATAARLRSMVKVVDPWLEREIGSLTELARPVSDASMSRWLRFVSLDHADDGEALFHLLAARSSEPTRFEDHALVSALDLNEVVCD